MPPRQLHSNVLREIAEGTPYATLDVFGPTLEFVSGPDDPAADFWVMRGVLPPGVAVPLHSHDDAEDFFILAGTQQVLTMGDQGLQWTDVNAGDYVHIPAGVPHAHRNVSDDPAVELVVTTARLGDSSKKSPVSTPGNRQRRLNWPSSLPWPPDTAMTSARRSRTPPRASP